MGRLVWKASKVITLCKSGVDGVLPLHFPVRVSSKRTRHRNFPLSKKAKGQVFSFGRGNFGQLGYGTQCDSHFPKNVPLCQAVTDIACGSEHTVALTCDAQLFSWGWNEHGNLGTGDTANRFSPFMVRQFPEGKAVVIGAGGAHSLIAVT